MNKPIESGRSRGSVEFAIMSFSQYLRWLVFCVFFILIGVIGLAIDPGAIHKPDQRARRAVRYRLGGTALCGFGLAFAIVPMFLKSSIRAKSRDEYSFWTVLRIGVCVLVYGIAAWAPVVLLDYPPDVDVRPVHKLHAAAFWIMTILMIEGLVFVPFFAAKRLGKTKH